MEDVHVLAEAFIGRIAVHRGPSTIDEPNTPLQVGQNDAIYGLIDGRPEFQKYLLHLLMVGNVEAMADVAQKVPLAVVTRRTVILNPTELAVVVTQTIRHAESFLPVEGAGYRC